MECSQSFINLSQVVINSLKEKINLDTYYCFAKPEEAKQLLRVLDLFCDVNMAYVEVSFYNDPEKDQTIALKVFKKPFGYDYPLIKYLDSEVENFLDDIKITKTPESLRELVKTNFF
ncbi:hypothetical protein VPIG_00059 [Vibrio phage PWH3a-P1]|uniref:hypothetical protein n=1 Tax=Vibrio phage PWH3a-P1 TaxID=754058 RepID=UPI0002C05B1B|nr:hypothetical protein VPIG_00059 [Vibrio phage PWH3a-P1]AGH31917.1 hypothetical protein VPIG_00059 [Vibrio phage PWH3a-P1]